MSDYYDRLQKLREVVAIAVLPGNMGANDYMLGMANGLILAESIFAGHEPQYFNADGSEVAATKAVQTRIPIGGK